MQPIQLLDLTKDELRALLAGWGEPRYRADQIWGWLYHRFATSPHEMTDLPTALRDRLEADTCLNPLEPLATLDSKDRQTRKTLFALADGPQVEAVLMRYARRRTLCISTQAGCAIGCPFCATGQAGFDRNLSAGEIVAQVLFYARLLAVEGERVTNIVFMGMGEPLANYEATWAAIRRLNDATGFGLAARAMTLSTVGLAPGIRRMSQEPEQVGLAVSLHAPTDELRDRLVPINRRYPLARLMEVCREYIAATRRRVSFEYALMEGINDGDEQARQLADLLKGMLAHVNLIPLNPTSDSPYRGSSRTRVRAFQSVLEDRGLPVTVRMRRGIDIQAGCGQLRARYERGD
ncbi:MAG: 23S rRNA (adenine(2503)-C(2))-methyltransferase RlmN [Anaerolineae bacterium]